MNPEKFVLYLCGPMDFTSDNGVGWRKKITQQLVNIGLEKDNILDPSNKKNVLTHPRVDSNEGELIKKYKDEKNWEAIEDIMKEIAHVDLRMVDKADIIIACLPKQGDDSIRDFKINFSRELLKAFGEVELIKQYACREFDKINSNLEAMNIDFNKLCTKIENSLIPIFGTLHEIVVARQQKKPVLLIYEDDLKKMSSWLMWLVGHNSIFHSLDECVNYIRDVIKGKIQPNNEDWMILE